MAQDKEKLVALKNANRDIENDLEKYKQVINDMQINKNKSEEKMVILNRIQAEKVKNLMLQIEVLKKENKELERLQNEAAQSKLIEQLQKDINDYEMIIELLKDKNKKFIPEDKLEEATNAILKNLNQENKNVKFQSRDELKSQLKKLQDQLSKQAKGVNSSQNMEDSQMESASTLDFQVEETQADNAPSMDSTENLIKRREELVNENDDLKLNLKSIEQQIQQLEDEIQEKTDELNEFKSAKTDYNVLQKKMDALEREYDKAKSKVIVVNKQNPVDIRVADLEFRAKTQLENIKNYEKILKKQMDDLDSKNNSLEKEIKQLEELNNQLNKETTKATDLFKKMRTQKSEYTSQIKDLKEKLEKQKKFHEQESGFYQETLQISTKRNNDAEKKMADQIEKLKNQTIIVAKLEDQLETLKLKGIGAIDTQSLAVSWVQGTTAFIQGDTKDLLAKIKYLAKREIELQNKIEQIQQEIQYKDQKKKTQQFIKKKGVGTTIEQEELRATYQKQIQARCEQKIEELCQKINLLETQNKALTMRQKMLESKAMHFDVNDLESVGSAISISKKQLEQEFGQQSQNQLENQSIAFSNLSELKRELQIKDDDTDLKQKLIKMTQKEIELYNKIDKLEKKLEDPQMPQDEQFERQMKQMQTEYDLLIGKLTSRLSELQTKNIDLERMDSNIGSIIGSDDKFDQQQMNDIDSNIDFSLNEIKKNDISISKVSSDIGSILKKDQSEQFNQDDLKSVSSGISKISGMNKKTVKY